MRSQAPEQFGNYLLHERIGAGGMAEIFLATAPGLEGLQTELVIKKILPSLSDDEQFVKMFIEEAQLCVFLRHPNVVQVYDLGEIDEQYFIAMEYVAGQDLLKTLAACAKKRVAFPTDLALYIVMEVLKGLDYAHNLKNSDGQPLGIIHRDVSPSNVLLSYDGEVKISDFGIAKASIREKTATGILKGKFGYMAPEQVIGVPIDHRADVFAVGILLYELLTGHRLFAGRNDLAVLERVRDARIEPPPRHYRPDLADQLESIVLKALSREANGRFQSTAELHDALYNYTFKTGVVLGPRMLARFMHEIFLRDMPEESLPWASSVHSVAPIRRSNARRQSPARQPIHTPEPDLRAESSTSQLQYDHDDPTNAGSTPGTPLRTSQVESVQQTDGIYEDEPEDVTRQESSTGDQTRPANEAAGSSPWNRRPSALSKELRAIRAAQDQNQETDLDLSADPAPGPIGAELEFDDDGGTPMGGVPVVGVGGKRRVRTQSDPSMFETVQGEEAELDAMQSVRTSLSNVVFRPGTDSPSELEQARREFAREIDRAMEPVGDTTELLGSVDDDDLEMAEPDDLIELDGSEEDAKASQSPSERVAITASEIPESQAVESIGASPLEVDPTLQDMSVIDGTSQIPTGAVEPFVEADPLFGPVAGDTIRGMDSPYARDESATDGSSEPQNITLAGTQDGAVGALLDPADSPSRTMDDSPSFATIMDDDGPAEADGVFSTIQEEPPEGLQDDTEGLDLDEVVMALQPTAPRPPRTGGSAASSRIETALELERDNSMVTAEQTHEHDSDPSLGGRIESAYATAAAVTPPRMRSRRVLSPAEATEEAHIGRTARPRPSSGLPPTPSQPARKRISVPQSELSVVNPPGHPKAHLDEPTSRGDLVEPNIARAATALGDLDSNALVPAVIPGEPRKLTTGVRAALSESQQVDMEIEEIRRSSGIDINEMVVQDEKTALGDLAPLLGDEPTREEPLDEGAGDYYEAIARRASRRRYTSDSVVLFDDSEETNQRNELPKARAGVQSGPITSAGRLDDRGASDLFGALSLIEERSEVVADASFDPDEEASLEATAAEMEPSRSRDQILAPSVAAALRDQDDRMDSDLRVDSHTRLGDLAGPPMDPSEMQAPEWERPPPRAPSLAYREPEDDADEPTQSVVDDEDGLDYPSNVPVRSGSFPATGQELDDGGRGVESMSLQFEDDRRRQREEVEAEPGYESYDDTPAMLEDDLIRAPSVINDPAIKAPSFQSVQHTADEETDGFDERFSSDFSGAGLLSDSFALIDGPKSRRKGSSPRAPSIGAPIALPGNTREHHENEDIPPTRQRASSIPVISPSASSDRPSRSSNRPAPGDIRFRKVVERTRPVKERNRRNDGSPQRPVARPEETATGAISLPPPSVSAPPELPAEALQPVDDGSQRLVTFLVPMAVALVVLAGSLFGYRYFSKGAPKPILPAKTTPSELANRPAPSELANRPAPSELANRPAPTPTKPPEPPVLKSSDTAAGALPATEPARELGRTEAGDGKPAETAPAEAKSAEPPKKSAAPAAPKRARKKASRKPKRRRRRAASKPKARKPAATAKPKARSTPKAAAPSAAAVGTIKLKCREPAKVRIAGLKTYSDVTTKAIEVPPGGYRVIIRRADGVVTTNSVKVLAGKATRVPCD